MKRNKLNIAVALLICGSLTFSSCIGSFGLTHKVLDWNKSIGNKWVNEAVFFCFMVLPVYELTGLADVLVLNSIEFWKGTNPVYGSKFVEGENSQYVINSHEKGYTITDQNTNESVELVYDNTDDSWSAVVKGESHKFLTFVDDNNVNVYDIFGNATTVELSESGVLAYKDAVKSLMPVAMK